MARFLALDWDHQQLNVILASVRHGRVRILKTIALTEEQSPNPAEAESLGRLLHKRLKDADIQHAPVLACVGRDRIILNEVHHPPVPAAEEAAIVRFQVLKELNDPPDEVVVDYAAAGVIEATGERRALTVVIRRELLTTYQTLCRAAGLKLAGLCPRPFGTIACLKQHLASHGDTPVPDPGDGAVAVLTIGKPWAEFCVVRGNNLLLARSLVVSDALPREVRRNMAVYAGQSHGRPVRAIYVVGGAEHAALRDQLQKLEEVPVYPFDPFAGAEHPTENRGAFAAALGLLYARAEFRSLPVNFTKPKQPKPPQNANRRRLGFVAAAAATFLLAVFVYCFVQLDNRDRKLGALFEEDTALDHQLARLGEDSKRIKALDDWTRGQIVWLDELYDLTDRFPDPANLRLAQLTGDPMTPTTKSPYAARIILKGIMTADYQPVNQLESRLVNDGHYRVEPKVIARNTGPDRRRFPQQFTTRVEIEKLDPEKYVRRLPDLRAITEADKGRNAGGDSSDFGFGGFDGGQP